MTIMGATIAPILLESTASHIEVLMYIKHYNHALRVKFNKMLTMMRSLHLVYAAPNKRARNQRDKKH